VWDRPGALFTRQAPVTARVQPALPLRSQITGGCGSSLKGLAIIAWGWHGTCLPQVDVPQPTLNSEGVGYTARGIIPANDHMSDTKILAFNAFRPYPMVGPRGAWLSVLLLSNDGTP
jgi:hypothetical protein